MSSCIQLVLLILLSLPKTTSASGCDIRCKCSQTAMTCSKYMPITLPVGIQTLTVEGNADETKSEFWADKSWDRLGSLTLQNYESFSFISRIYNFSNLNNLTYFGLHSTNFDQLKNAELKAMPSLKVLDLSGTIRLTFPTIISALSGGNLPHLEELNLDLVATDPDQTYPNRFDNNFVKVLIGKPLKKLIITNTMLAIETALLVQLKTLEFINISGPWFPIGQFRFPREFGDNTRKTTLDISGSVISAFKDTEIRNVYETSCDPSEFTRFLLSITNVYLNSISQSGSLENYTFNTTFCSEESAFKFNTKTLHLRNNGFKKFDINIVGNQDFGLELLDISGNILEYISPNFFKLFDSLTTLNLDSNLLHKMEQNQDFLSLFMHLPKLKFLKLSSNQISFLPIDMFIQNKNLSEIDISSNMITVVDLSIQQLHELRILNVAGNRIKFLETGFLLQLDKLSLLPSLREPYINETYSKVIILKGNSFDCSCDSVAFIKWFISHNNQTEAERAPKCLLEGTSTTMNHDVVAKSKYLCIKDTVETAIYTTSVLLVITIVCILLVLYVCRRRRERINNMERLIRTFRQEALPRYLLFFSYCSKDDTLATQRIYPLLSDTLGTKINCNRKLVCDGCSDFRLGYTVHEEMVRCISESCVVVLLVTNAFCESRWCETELQEAATQNKPIVLFLVDKVDEDLMSPYLQTLFRRYTRVLVTTNDNVVIFKPDIHTVCLSLLELAADGQKFGGFYELLHKSVSGTCCRD